VTISLLYKSVTFWIVIIDKNRFFMLTVIVCCVSGADCLAFQLASLEVDSTIHLWVCVQRLCIVYNQLPCLEWQILCCCI